MKNLIVIFFMIINPSQFLIAQEIRDTVIAKYFEKVGLHKLLNISSYVYYYQSSNSYNSNMFQKNINHSDNIRFYKNIKNNEFYRLEGHPFNSKKNTIALYNDVNPTFNILEDNHIKHIDPILESKKHRLVDLDLRNYSFEICKQVLKAHDEKKLSYQGIEEFKGIKCFRYLLENDFLTKYIYFDVDTYLLKGSKNKSVKNLTKSQKLNLGPPTQYVRIYEDYVDIEGILIPTKITTYKNGEFRDSFVFKDIKFNVKLEDNIFYDALNKSEYSFK